MGLATSVAGREMATTTKRSWLLNQSLFTLRRLAYGVTLGFIAGGVTVLKWGNDFNNAMQGARVSLRPFFSSSQELEHSLDRLWTIAKFSPFQIQDMTLAFARMYPSMSRLGISADEVTTTLKNLTDALSVGMAGRVTPAALNRASIALQHLAFLGRLTGMSVLQLARDGIPIYAALSKELGLTGEQMHNIGKLGIPASVALKAINDYISSTPGYANAAQRLSNRSVLGLFSQLKDNISRTMGLAEKGWFKNFKGMLVNANLWFNTLNKNMDRTHNLTRAIDASITPQSHTFLRVWTMLSATVRDAWHIFTTFMNTLVRSKAIWGTIILALLTLHGVLAAAAHTTWLWVPILRILIPLIILYWVWTKAITFAEILYWAAVRQSIVWQFRLAWATRLLNAAKRAYIILTGGEIAAANGQFVKFSRLEKMVIKLRRAFVMLAAGEWLAAGPIGILVVAAAALVIGLVYLYFHWKRFHNAVNATVQFLWRHWQLLALIPIVGPFIAAAAGIIHHWKQIVNLIRTAVHWLGRFHMPHIGLPGFLPHVGFPRLAGGGTARTGGFAMVGEHGPEILSMPRGASVVPLSGLRDRLAAGPPQVIKLVVDGRVLAEVVARHQTAVNARG
jgi:hypothetical protein